MKINQIFRYSRPYSIVPETIDGYRNFFSSTVMPTGKKPLLDSGINGIHPVIVDGVIRRPAILISSSPHKIGSFETPWQDFFDIENGHIRYYGDNKSNNTKPEETSGNKLLLEEYLKQTDISIDLRKKSTPILFFKRVSVGGKRKGYVQFKGFGIIEKIELVTQINPKTQSAFSNYVFDFAVFNLLEENEQFDWSWIQARAKEEVSLDETLSFAPKAWKTWISKGPKIVNFCKRKVSKLLITKRSDQLPDSRKTENILKEIYTFYEGRKARFEGLAMVIAEKVMNSNGYICEMGWITPSTSDGGADFVGKLTIGQGFSFTNLVVLGQAKCEKINSPTGGNHIARTVARLKRGWIGVYVTTSYFSDNVQKEIIEDNYPIILINGKIVAQTINRIVFEQGYISTLSFLEEIDSKYDNLVHTRRPEEILYT